MKKLFPVICLFSCLIAAHSFAGSATWNLNPTSGDWNTAANWTPATVPNGSADVATFGASNTTGISLASAVTVNSMVFNPSASAFTFTASMVMLTISGTGIVNDSGATQNFVANGSSGGTVGSIDFFNTATAANASFTVNGSTTGGGFGGQVFFYDDSNAATAVFNTFGGIASGGGAGNGGAIRFYGNASARDCTITNHATLPGGNQPGLTSFDEDATAENATITNEGGGNPTTGPYGAFTYFSGNATAANSVIANDGAGASDITSGGTTIFINGGNGGNATFISNGGGSADAGGGLTEFSVGSNAGGATLIANSSPFSGTVSGGAIAFSSDSDGGTCRIILHGNGNLILSNHDDTTPITVGSIEGDGVVILDYRDLIVGRNGRNTTFSGLIAARNGDGTVTKIGPGSWTLTKSSSYTFGTFIEQGQLIANNKTGSATGNSPVLIKNGVLAGRGIVAGVVTVGNSNGHLALISPGARGVKDIGTLTLQRSVTFNNDGLYAFQVDSDNNQSDTLNTAGIVINGAQFVATDLGTSSLSVGTVFTAINNTSAKAITGRFMNLPDGSTFPIGTNTFQANYEGGDGNDLTLTVVP